MARPKVPYEPRPTCPECGGIVDPRYAVSYPGDLPGMRNLYCSSDCLLDAYQRAKAAEAARKRVQR